MNNIYLGMEWVAVTRRPRTMRWVLPTSTRAVAWVVSLLLFLDPIMISGASGPCALGAQVNLFFSCCWPQLYIQDSKYKSIYIIFTDIIILSYYPIICSPRSGILFPCEDGTLFADPKHGLYIIKENVLSLWDKCSIIKFIYIYPCGSCFKGFITINTIV